MLDIARYNILEVGRLTDFGAYLHAPGEETPEVLMPRKFFPEDKDLTVGDKVEVFVYTDTEDRPIATTERPFALAGECAYLQCMDVNKTGAFLDWGLEAKQLMVPYAEQIVKMRPGMQYLVYVYVDEMTGRAAASARIDRFLDHERPPFKMGDEVDTLVAQHLERMGYKCIVDNKWRGMIYETDLFEPLVIGSTMRACVKYIRDDNKIDLTPGARVEHRMADIAERLYFILRDQPSGELRITDRSTPEEIHALLGCSKKDFKRAVGKLFKERKIAIEVDRIRLAD